MFQGSQAELYWFLLGLALMLSELALPGFVIIFFGIGAWVTAACIWLGFADALNTQLLIFIISSVLSLVLFRKQGKDYFRGRVSGKLDDVAKLDDVKGDRALVVEDIVPARLSGKVEFHGTNWNAVADAEIKKGTPVEILGREDLTLRVKPIN
ncbi:MAG: NfeD family protein [Ignavibacteriae bacterium]|nr:NfeD family protein [Ignavibacteriota bacterium]